MQYQHNPLILYDFCIFKKIVRCFYVQDKAKPAVRQGRKSTGLNVLRTIVFYEMAELP